MLQRSRGYQDRPSLLLCEIEKACKIIKEANPNAIIFVDNCYGEFVEDREPLEAGADILHSERSYDLALVTLFENREAFDAYQTHPVHMPVKKRMHEVRSGSVACDFEV